MNEKRENEKIVIVQYTLRFSAPPSRSLRLHQHRRLKHHERNVRKEGKRKEGSINYALLLIGSRPSGRTSVLSAGPAAGRFPF